MLLALLGFRHNYKVVNCECACVVSNVYFMILEEYKAGLLVCKQYGDIYY